MFLKIKKAIIYILQCLVIICVILVLPIILICDWLLRNKTFYDKVYLPIANLMETIWQTLSDFTKWCFYGDTLQGDLKLLDSPFLKWRREAVSQLVRYGDTSVMPVLFEKVMDENETIRDDVLFKLGWIETDKLSQYMFNGLQHSKVEVREGVVRALLAMREPDTIDILKIALQDREEKIVFLAAIALVSLNEEGVLPIVYRAVNSDDFEISYRAKSILCLLKNRDENDQDAYGWYADTYTFIYRIKNSTRADRVYWAIEELVRVNDTCAIPYIFQYIANNYEKLQKIPHMYIFSLIGFTNVAAKFRGEDALKQYNAFLKDKNPRIRSMASIGLQYQECTDEY